MQNDIDSTKSSGWPCSAESTSGTWSKHVLFMETIMHLEIFALSVTISLMLFTI